MDLDASRHQKTDGETSELVTVTRQVPRLLISVAHLAYLVGEAHLAPGAEQLEQLNSNTVGGSAKSVTRVCKLASAAAVTTNSGTRLTPPRRP